MEEEPALGIRRGEPGREWGSTHTGSEMVGPLLCVDPACLRAGASPGPHGRAEGTAGVRGLPLGPAGAGKGSEEV